MVNKIGIIGGSGMEDPDLLKNPSSKTIDTPYGKPLQKLFQAK